MAEPLLFDFEHLGGKFKMSVTGLTTVDPAGALTEKKKPNGRSGEEALSPYGPDVPSLAVERLNGLFADLRQYL